MASLKEVGKKKLIIYVLMLSQDILTSLIVHRDILHTILEYAAIDSFWCGLLDWMIEV